MPAAVGAGHADAGFEDGEQELRILGTPAGRGVVADVPHVDGVGAGAHGLVDIPQDHAGVVAPGAHVGRGTGERLPMDEAGAGGVVQWHGDHVHEVADGCPSTR